MDSPRALFVMGSGRCGSTRLFDLLNAHDRICLTDEARVVDYLVFIAELAGLSVAEEKLLWLERCHDIRGVIRPAYTDCWMEVVRAAVPRLFGEFYAKVAERQVAYWGDKLPGTAAALRMREVMPDARYIAVIRDPRDYLASVKSYVGQPHIAKHHAYLSVSDEDHLAHWRQTYEGIAKYAEDCLTIRYEDLIRAPAETLDAVLNYLGLELTAACRDAIASQGTFKDHGTSATITESVGRYEWDLTPVQIARVQEACASLMREFGYLGE